jgi:hypothetical protein
LLLDGSEFETGGKDTNYLVKEKNVGTTTNLNKIEHL